MKEKQELDLDAVLAFLKTKGWGDVHNEIEPFEESDYYSGTQDTKDYGEEMHSFLRALQNGDIHDESPY